MKPIHVSITVSRTFGTYIGKVITKWNRTLMEKAFRNALINGGRRQIQNSWSERGFIDKTRNDGSKNLKESMLSHCTAPIKTETAISRLIAKACIFERQISCLRASFLNMILLLWRFINPSTNISFLLFSTNKLFQAKRKNYLSTVSVKFRPFLSHSVNRA